MWEVKCTVCELVDMTCFASFRAQTIAEVLCHVNFFEALYRWHGAYAFVLFYFADDMGVCVFLVCPTTPMSSAGTIYVYIHICIHICKYVFIYIYICIYIYMCVCLYLYICICIYIHICIYMCLHMYLYMFTYIYVYIYVWIHVYMIYVYICIYMYTGRPKDRILYS